MKDNFSDNSQNYAIYRPSYPKEVFEIIYSHIEGKKIAWDCATGNGQVANILAQDFEKVYATDISQNQLKNAVQKENIVYSVEQAEKSSFEDNSFDLITVAQAIHWFDFDKFYKEVYRTLRKNGLFVVLGYGKIEIDTEIDEIIDKLYYDILGDFWDIERKYIDKNYTTIPFPFKEIEQKKNIVNQLEWNLDDLIGYLNTWSAIKHYNNQHSKNATALENIMESLSKVWRKEETKQVTFPIFLRMEKIKTV